MQILRVAPLQFTGSLQRRILRFVDAYKDRHITRETRHQLSRLKKSDLEKTGNLVLIAVQEKTLLGVLVAKEYGENFSLAVVNRHKRSKGVGKALLREAISECGAFYVEIASDNIPSLKIAFACGLLAYDVFARDTGKVVLRLKCQGEPLRHRDGSPVAEAAIENRGFPQEARL